MCSEKSPLRFEVCWDTLIHFSVNSDGLMVEPMRVSSAVSTSNLVFYFVSSVGVVATQLWWQEHTGRCCWQILHWSPTHPVVGMDTTAPDLPCWIRRQTSAQPNQPGDSFWAARQLSYIILLLSHIHHLLFLFILRFSVTSLYISSTLPSVTHNRSVSLPLVSSFI